MLIKKSKDGWYFEIPEIKFEMGPFKTKKEAIHACQKLENEATEKLSKLAKN